MAIVDLACVCEVQPGHWGMLSRRGSKIGKDSCTGTDSNIEKLYVGKIL